MTVFNNANKKIIVTTTHNPVKAKKRIKLTKRIYDFRETYLYLAKKDRFKYDYIKTDEESFRRRYLKEEMQKDGHSKRRYIYYVQSDTNWIKSFLSDHQKLIRAIKNYDELLTQDCWVPPILQDVRCTYVKKYKAYSVKSKIKYKELKETHQKKFISFRRKKFKSKRRTGMQYRLVILSNANLRTVLPFPDWAICICHTMEKPIMYGRDMKNAPNERSRLKVKPMN